MNILNHIEDVPHRVSLQGTGEHSKVKFTALELKLDEIKTSLNTATENI